MSILIPRTAEIDQDLLRAARESGMSDTEIKKMSDNMKNKVVPIFSGTPEVDVGTSGRKVRDRFTLLLSAPKTMTRKRGRVPPRSKKREENDNVVRVQPVIPDQIEHSAPMIVEKRLEDDGGGSTKIAPESAPLDVWATSMGMTVKEIRNKIGILSPVDDNGNYDLISILGMIGKEVGLAALSRNGFRVSRKTAVTIDDDEVGLFSDEEDEDGEMKSDRGVVTRKMSGELQHAEQGRFTAASFQSTTALPGTSAKAAILQERVKLGLPLWHPQDLLRYEYQTSDRREETLSWNSPNHLFFMQIRRELRRRKFEEKEIDKICISLDIASDRELEGGEDIHHVVNALLKKRKK